MSILKNLLPQILYEGSSQYSNDIKVIKYGNTTKLIVNGFVQSFNDNSGFAKNKVWGQVVKIIIENKPNLNNILVLGMGGGTMLHLLNEKYPAAKITAVEIDEVIIKIARRYFNIAESSNLKIINTDAAEILENSGKFDILNKFDCIIVDTYIGGEYPEAIGNSLLSNIFELCADNGLVIFNRIVYKDKEEIINQFEDKLKLYMKNVNLKKIKYPSIADNYIFYGYNSSK